MLNPSVSQVMHSRRCICELAPGRGEFDPARILEIAVVVGNVEASVPYWWRRPFLGRDAVDRAHPCLPVPLPFTFRAARDDLSTGDEEAKSHPQDAGTFQVGN